MSFSIVSNSPQTVWCPVARHAGTLYVGQLVRQYGDGVAAIDTATGIADIAHKLSTRAVIGSTVASSAANNVIFGVVIGTNKKIPSFSTTYKAESVAWASPAGATSEDYVSVEGEWPKGDRLAMVKVALIDPTTIIRGRIFNAAYGTAPTPKTVLNGGATVVGFSALDCPTIANMSTIYFRTGNAAGTYRLSNLASSTEVEFRTLINGSTATTAYVGAKVCVVNLRPMGISRMQVNSTVAAGLFIDSNASCDTHYFAVNVIRLNLSSSGNEYCDFQFPAHHCQPSADSTGNA